MVGMLGSDSVKIYGMFWCCIVSMLSLQPNQLHWCFHSDNMQSDSVCYSNSGNWTGLPAFHSTKHIPYGIPSEWFSFRRRIIKCACSNTFPSTTLKRKSTNRIISANFDYRHQQIKKWWALMPFQQNKNTI